MINDILLFTLGDITFLLYQVTSCENLTKGPGGLMDGSPSTKVTTVFSLVVGSWCSKYVLNFSYDSRRKYCFDGLPSRVSLTKIIFENSTKVRMTHFNISVIVSAKEITM